LRWILRDRLKSSTIREESGGVHAALPDIEGSLELGPRFTKQIERHAVEEPPAE